MPAIKCRNLQFRKFIYPQSSESFSDQQLMSGIICLKILFYFFNWRRCKSTTKKSQEINLRLGLISAHDISATVISTKTFHHGNISALVHFGSADVPASVDISTWRIFGTRAFRHKDIKALGYFRHCGWLRNVTLRKVSMPKCPSDEMAVLLPKFQVP